MLLDNEDVHMTKEAHPNRQTEKEFKGEGASATLNNTSAYG